eukprot:TRINITY_DN9713_c0_g1_i1.p1 TRINITY_DN9713_c0_g1~~TRINITY_DN9713_c0_g1_i1.p1  ORF type:complete len:214 (-),score=28.05 TRINITY_DN9713_c0_g1_i1:409-1014(-)
MIQSENSVKTVYLIRHAKTTGNVWFETLMGVLTKLITCSWSFSRAELKRAFQFPSEDPNLTDVGVAQLKEIAAQFQEMDFHRDAKIELILHSDLQRTRKTCAALFGSLNVPVLELRTLREFYLPKDFCSSCTFAARVRKCEELLASRPERVIAIVGHGMYFKRLQRGKAAHFDNVEVRRCTFDVRSTTVDAGQLVCKPRQK